jgi:hypothetical protein
VQDAEGKENSTAIIAGVVSALGAVLLVAAAVMLIVWRTFKRRQAHLSKLLNAAVVSEAGGIVTPVRHGWK